MIACEELLGPLRSSRSLSVRLVVVVLETITLVIVICDINELQGRDAALKERKS